MAEKSKLKTKVKIKRAHGTSSVTEVRSSTHSSPQNHNTMTNHEEDSEDCNSKIPTETTHEKSAQAYEKLVGLLPDAIEELQKMGPDSTDEFISVVKALSKGYLTENISFHLMLDIGRFYETSSVTNMRYNDETMSFWVTIEKLFKGRGINFFRGYKARGIGTNAIPEDCRINWIVPNDKLLRKHRNKYTMDVNFAFGGQNCIVILSHTHTRHVFY